MVLKKTALSFGVAASIMMWAGVASAQQAAPDAPEATGSETALEEVTVTATKRETLMMETPVAVSAVTGAALERDGVQDVRQLGALVPSMQVGFSPSDSGVQVTIRGITSNNFTELGDPAVGIHLDGVYSPRPQAAMSLLHDVERIEVLRGPQGTLFGRNSTAGAINILARRPSFNGVTVDVEAEKGNFNHQAFRLIYNQPINDVLAVRLALSGEETDGYINQKRDTFDLDWAAAGIVADGIANTDQRWNRKVGKGEAYTAVNRWSARLSTLYSPNDRFDWLVSLESYTDTSPGGISLKDCEKAQGYYFACTEDQLNAYINVPGELNFKIGTARSVMTYRPSDNVVIEYRAAFSRERRSQAYDGDGGVFASPNDPAYGMAQRVCCGTNFGPLVNNPGAITGLGFNVASVALFPFEDLQLRTRWSRYDSLVQEFQIKSDGEGPLQWVAGIFDSREKNAIRFDVDAPFCCGTPVPLAQSFIQPDRQSISTAVFGQIDYAATSRLNLTAGYRYSWDKKSDKGGSNYQTIGYWVNPGQFDPSASFWMESWGLTGIVPGWNQQYQSNVLTKDMGTSSPTFTQRIVGSDNSYEADWSKGTWKLGLDYTLNDDTFFYASVATGYKAGGFGDKVDTCNCGNLTAFPYDPETDINYEVGVKARFPELRLNVIATLYNTEFNDMQKTGYVIVGQDARTNVYIGTNLTTNIAGARSRGVELEGDWIPYDGGRVTGWVAYNDSVITDFPDAEDGLFCFQRAYLGLKECPALDANNRRPANFVGNQLPWSPKVSATINYEHNWRLENGLRISPYVSVHWQSKMYFNDSNLDVGPFSFAQDSFATANAALRVISEKDQWGAEFYVYNLTDELVRQWMDPGPGFMRANFFPPRSFGLKVRKGF
ncbi:MAG: TonB-dependent receptor [Caulobacter sp.]|nr:TonB-dependent receptor [Caulobacter sp.]